MSYCNPGDKPRVDYKFNGKAGITYQSSVSPIDIAIGTTPFNTSSNYDPRGYQITFPSPQGAFGTIQLIVVDYKIFTYQGGNYLASIPCGGNSFPTTLDPYHAASLTGQVTEDHSVHCPNGVNNGTCTITISSQGKTLFKAQGNCPVTYVVTCGNCPPGTCQCHSDNYPGYCCRDCTGTSENLQNISNHVRRLNGR